MKAKTNYKIVLYGLVFFIISSALASASTTVIVVKFKPQTIQIPVGQKKATLADIDESRMHIKKYFEELSNDIEFEKLIPKAKPADTLYVNKKGEIKKLNDWSQVFRVTIPNSTRNMMDIIDDLVKFKDVEYAEPPVQIEFDYTPDDLHKEGNQWYLTKINAEDAWDITTGSSCIKIAVIEQGVASHTDINDKLTGGDSGSNGYHGLMVAGVAGCETNNDIGLASLGYNVMIVPKNTGGDTIGIATDIRDAADPSEDDADIINCSFKTIKWDGNEHYSYNYRTVELAVEDAIAWDKIVVASAGNPPNYDDQDEVPYTQWPAAYTGVIGVSATNSSDAFPSGYNYGSLVDLSAPGVNIRVLNSNNGYSTESGTSFSAPLVCALAALILSNDNSLTPTQVQETMELSAVDLGTTGRDDYFGHGRIDAYEAVRNLYVPEVYSTISSALANTTSGQTIVITGGTQSISASTTITSGVTLQINSGATINFTGSYKLNIYGTLTIAGSSGQHVTIDGMNYSRIGYSNAMIDIKDGAAANMQYADFTKSPYDLIIRNSADAEITNCTFSNFGFDSNSRAITAYNSTGTVTFNNCIFTGNGSNGIGIYANNTGTKVTISGSTFTNCRVGIRCYSSDAFITGNTMQNSYYYGIQSDNVTDDAEYRDNSISGNTGSYGIYLNSSSPYLMYNYIHNNKVLINAGSPEFATPESEGLGHRGYNTITNANSPLIKVQNYSSPFMGYYGGEWEDGGYNSIYETDLPHIYAVNHSSVLADNNYWGSEGPANAVDGTSSISSENPLSTNPNPLPKKIAANGFVINWDNISQEATSTQDDKNEEQKFKDALAAGFKSDKGYALIQLKHYQEAESSFQTALQMYPKLLLPRLWLAELYQQQERSGEAIAELHQILVIQPKIVTEESERIKSEASAKLSRLENMKRFQ